MDMSPVRWPAVSASVAFIKLIISRDAALTGRFEGVPHKSRVETFGVNKVATNSPRSISDCIAEAHMTV